MHCFVSHHGVLAEDVTLNNQKWEGLAIIQIVFMCILSSEITVGLVIIASHTYNVFWIFRGLFICLGLVFFCRGWNLFMFFLLLFSLLS